MARVLFITHRFWPYSGGSERMFLELARRAAVAGHSVHVFTTDAWDADHLAEPGYRRIQARDDDVGGVHIRRFRVHHRPPLQALAHRLMQRSGSSRLQGAPAVPFVPGLMRWARTSARTFDIVHAGVFPHLPLVRAAAVYCERHRIPLVCHPLLNLGEPYRAANNPAFLSPAHRATLAAADHVLATTDYECEALLRTGLDRSRITIVPPAVDVVALKGGNAESFRRRHALSGPIVLQVSTQTADKGSITTVEALKSLWKAGWHAELVLIGQVRRDFAAYMAAQPPAVRVRVRILDYTDETEKKDAFAACDVFVMPSRADAFGIAYLEAWVYERPVVGCFAGGVPRVIDDGEDGFLVPFGDASMLAEYLMILLGDRAHARAMGARGHAKVVTRFDWQRSADRVLQVYDRLLGAA